MGAILPFCVSLVHQFEVCLVDKGGGLKRVSRAFAAKIVARETAELVVDEGHQFFERGLVALAPVDQQLSYAIRVHPDFYNNLFMAREGIRAKPPR